MSLIWYFHSNYFRKEDGNVSGDAWNTAEWVQGMMQNGKSLLLVKEFQVTKEKLNSVKYSTKHIC